MGLIRPAIPAGWTTGPGGRTAGQRTPPRFDHANREPADAARPGAIVSLHDGTPPRLGVADGSTALTYPAAPAHTAGPNHSTDAIGLASPAGSDSLAGPGAPGRRDPDKPGGPDKPDGQPDHREPARVAHPTRPIHTASLINAASLIDAAGDTNRATASGPAAVRGPATAIGYTTAIGSAVDAVSVTSWFDPPSAPLGAGPIYAGGAGDLAATLRSGDDHDATPAWAGPTRFMSQIGRAGDLTPAQAFRAGRGRVW